MPTDYSFLHARGINGRVLYSLKDIPSDVTTVPSLGRVADLVLDAMGYPTSTVSLLHNTFIQAHQVEDDPCQLFIAEMVRGGMSVLEATMFYGIIEISSGETTKRVRFNVDIV